MNRSIGRFILFIMIALSAMKIFSQNIDGKWESSNGNHLVIQTQNEGVLINFNNGAGILFIYNQPSLYVNSANGLTCQVQNSTRLLIRNTWGVEEVYTKINTVNSSANGLNGFSNGMVRTERHATVNSMSNLAKMFIKNDKGNANTNTLQSISTIPIDNENNEIISDIDTEIPEGKNIKSNYIALIIGNENYKQEIKVPYARKDATTFSEYCKKTLGIPSTNVKVILDGTYGEMLGAIDWVNKVIRAFNGKANVFFYYAGHGMPDEVDKSAYFLPIDGSADNPSTGIKQDFVFNKLSENPAELITVFLDACFSGGARDGMLAQGRGVSITPREKPLEGNIVVFSATSSNETALPYTGQSHGLFTYFLLKKMKETKGDTNYGEMMNYLIEAVTQNSLILNGKVQNPKIIVSNTLYNQWESLKFNN